MEEALRQATHAGGAGKVMPQSKAPTSRRERGSKPQPITAAQVWLLLRRAMVLAAAVLYVVTSLEGGLRAVEVLYGVADNSFKYPVMGNSLIASYAGTSAIGKGKLVTTLGGTAQRNDTVYLLSATDVSFQSCPQTPQYNSWMYGNAFLRSQYSDLVRDTSYNITLLKTSELIAPVVDCTSYMLRAGTAMYMRVFFLLRDKTDRDVVTLVTYSFAIQDYRFPDQYQTGVAGMVVLSVVSDMRFQSVDAYHYAMALAYPFRKGTYIPFEFHHETTDGFRVFESILPTGSTEPTRVIYTSWRTGIFATSESEQSNIKNINWAHHTNPVEAMSDWQWIGLSLLKDSWSWVHVMHFVFAADMIFNLTVLMLVIFRNLRKGKFWIGDAFVSFSRSVVFRGFLVLLGWYIDGFWTIMEFCIQEGKILTKSPLMFIHPEIIHADLMVIYLSLAGLLGLVLRERIDPALSVFLFEIGFTCRHAIVKWFPSILQTIVAFSMEDASRGIMAVPAKLADISPMRLRTTHDLHAKPIDFILAVLFPVLITFLVLIVYAPLRKIHRKFFPDRMVKLSRGTDMSTECDAILAWKCSLTMFEVATGAALQNRVGLVSDYDNCVYIKGMKFASADGIYCNGFVVANARWLMRTSDLPLILAMILMRVRLSDVYVYEVEAFTVQKNARLFYPEMMTFTEFFELNTMILA